MTKKMVVSMGLFLAIILAAPSVQAFSVRLGGSISYYALSDSVINNIYGSGGIQFGGFLAMGLGKSLELRAEAGSFKATGKMTVSKELIDLSEILLTAGLRFQVLDKKLSPYLGAGVGIVNYKENYPNRFEDVSDSAFGFYGESGIYLFAGRHFLLDLNIRYLSAGADGFEEKVNLGGIRAGLNIGLRF